MSTPDTPSTPVLRAMGIGGFFGGLISCVFIGWWGVLVAVGLFVGTAILAATIDGISTAIRNQKEKNK
jgi:hypothetical protein